jgi:hypothetical protein
VPAPVGARLPSAAGGDGVDGGPSGGGGRAAGAEGREGERVLLAAKGDAPAVGVAREQREGGGLAGGRKLQRRAERLDVRPVRRGHADAHAVRRAAQVRTAQHGGDQVVATHARAHVDRVRAVAAVAQRRARLAGAARADHKRALAAALEARARRVARREHKLARRAGGLA